MQRIELRRWLCRTLAEARNDSSKCRNLPYEAPLTGGERRTIEPGSIKSSAARLVWIVHGRRIEHLLGITKFEPRAGAALERDRPVEA